MVLFLAQVSKREQRFPMTTAHFLISGQSNVDQWFHTDDGSTLDAFKSKYMQLNPGVTDVILVNERAAPAG